MFSLTLYTDGEICTVGHGDHSAIPAMLRAIADSVEACETVFRAEE